MNQLNALAEKLLDSSLVLGQWQARLRSEFLLGVFFKFLLKYTGPSLTRKIIKRR